MGAGDVAEGGEEVGVDEHVVGCEEKEGDEEQEGYG